jgi:hypothetical protein
MTTTKHELLVAHENYVNIVKCRTSFAVGKHFFKIYSTVSDGTMPCGTLDGKH